MKTPANRSASYNLQGYTVLLIDDDPTNLGVISDCLSGADLEVLIARDGESGLQKARYARPHIILLDVVMPGLDGFETCRRLKADAVTKDIPVLFMTALTGTRDKVRAYEAGAADYVTKPVQVEELLARVRAHLALRNMTQHLHDQDAQVQQALAEREQAEAARQISEARLRTIVDQLPFDLWAMNDQLQYIMQNATHRKQYGDVIGQRIEDLHLPTELEAQWLEQDRRVLAGETSHQAYDLEVATGKQHYENIVAPVKVDEAIVGLVGIAMDVTERKQTEEELRLYREHLEELVTSRTAALQEEVEERTRVQSELSQVNRMLRLLSECNQVLVRATDEAGLLEKICHFIVELGGYPLVWVGLIEHVEDQTMRLAAHVGGNAGDVIDFIAATDKLENGPVGRALRSGQPGIVNDIQNEPGDALWQAEASRRGYASLIAVPLQTDDQVIGALSISAAQPNAFHAEEVKLLLELASDLAYGLLALRTRAERQQAEAALAEQHRLLRTLIDAMPDRIYVKDADSRFLLANNMVAWIMGTTPEEAIGKRDFNFYSQELAERYYADEQALLASGQPLIDREELGVDLAGNVHWISTTKVPFRDEQGKIKGFVGIGRDITVRKEMEHVLRQARDELEARVEERTRELKRNWPDSIEWPRPSPRPCSCRPCWMPSPAAQPSCWDQTQASSCCWTRPRKR
jgi:PAS domain S-box-containing protein